MRITTIAALALIIPVAAMAETTIEGNIASKCIINTDTQGVYGNPTPDKLSTATTDGGVLPIIRYDVAIADYYTAKITTPTSFSTSPTLSDTVAWSGSTSVSNTSDASMSGYETNKVTYEATTEFDLTVAGTVWFEVSSTAEYGYSKAFPGGTYRAIVQAECIAN